MTTTGESASNPSAIRLSILLVTYRSREVILRCLRSLQADDPANPWEIIVVDNASADGTCEAVRSEFPWVRVIANETNRGFPAAINQAAQEAKGSYLLLLNPDTVVTPESLDSMLQWMDRHPEVGACGPTLSFPDGRVQPSVLPLPTLANSVLAYAGVRQMPGLDMDQPTLFSRDLYLLGACLMIRRVAWEEVGSLDPRLFWIEDAEWALRAGQAGWRLAYLPQVSAVHVGEASAHKDIFVKLTRQHLNRFEFFKKHGSWVEYNALRMAVLLVLAVKYTVRAVQLPFAQTKAVHESLRAYRHATAVLLGRRQERWS
jgi:GT2 family glycosyltransferase